LGHSFNKENSDKLVLVHLLVEIINYTKMHGEYKVKFIDSLIQVNIQVKTMNIEKKMYGMNNIKFICSSSTKLYTGYTIAAYLMSC
jgi:hypothetical protein